MDIISNPSNYLLSGQTSSGTGARAIDTRAAANYAYVVYVASSPSAVIKLQASHDLTAWMDVVTYTASPTTGSAQQAGYYPYVRAVVNSAFGGGGVTASAMLWYGARVI